MKTVQEKIAIMQAFVDGKKLELKWLDRPDSKWVEVTAENPWFDWKHCDYRIKEDYDLEALKTYIKGKDPTDNVEWVLNHWSHKTKEDVKAGLRAVINAVKAGEIQ